MQLAVGAPRVAGPDAHAELVYEMQWQASHTERESLSTLALTGAACTQKPLDHRKDLSNHLALRVCSGTSKVFSVVEL